MTVIPKTHVALHENYSLLNHSCNPNCNSFCIGGTIVVLCMFNLSPGEELTISYCEEFDLQPRRENLQSIWDIDCDCKLCEEQLYEIKSGKMHPNPQTFVVKMGNM